MSKEIDTHHACVTANVLEHKGSSSANDFHNPIQKPDDHAHGSVGKPSNENAIAPFQCVINLTSRAINEERRKNKSSEAKTINSNNMSTKANNTFDGIPVRIAHIADAIDLIKSLMTSEFYTGEQLSQKLQVSLQTLRRWRKQRWLNYSKIGRRIFYSNEDVMKMLGRFYVNQYMRNSFDKSM